MFENIKLQLWDILKKKEVSLVMIFDKKGDILWHKGRKILGKSIHNGIGFPKSYTRKVISQDHLIEKEDVQVDVLGDNLSESAKFLDIKNLLIIPIQKNFFLYIDSGTKEAFTKADIEIFRIMGQILGKMIEKVIEDQEDRDGITGDSEKIKEIIYGNGYKKTLPDTISNQPHWKDEIQANLRAGKSFWQVVKEPFLNRDLNRRQVKAILSEALVQTEGNYKDTLRLFNIDNGEYGSFMKFLYRNKLN